MSSDSTAPRTPEALVSTGVEALDEVLHGGLTPNRLYLLEGFPGTGKTTLAMQFLLEGVRAGESVLHVSLSESGEELRGVADSHGWSLSGIDVLELMPSESELDPEEQYTMFHPSEVELSETIKTILAEVSRVRPSRLVFDSLSELRLLAGSPLRYRRQVLALKRFFVGRKCTVLLLDDRSGGDDLQLHSIAHGVVSLDRLQPEYGGQRRRLQVVKYRGRAFRGGYHDYVIQKGGLDVFPRLVAAEHRQRGARGKLSSGLAGLDALLGGGIERGTSTLVMGPAGAGKSTVAAQFVVSAAAQGQNAAMFIFDESEATLLSRLDSLAIPLREHVENGRVRLQVVDPAELSPGELVQIIRRSVERQNAAVIVVDSLNGYMNAMPEERFLTAQLHELLTYLGQRGVATLLISAHQGLIGSQMQAAVDVTYLADAVILLRYFESRGAIHQAISVIKNRGGDHERTIREFRLADGQLTIGEPLKEFRGVLTGVPTELGGSGSWKRGERDS